MTSASHEERGRERSEPWGSTHDEVPGRQEKVAAKPGEARAGARHQQ
jgi:hypothetical protein